jgi:hypothetical protein
MTTPSARTSIAALPRGHTFDRAVFRVTADEVRAYAQAVGDATDYGDAVPPLAVLALGLLVLQDVIALPEGSLHIGQEVEHAGVARCGEPLTLDASIVQRSERQGYVISVIELAVSTEQAPVLSARTTIMAPAEAAA